MIVMKQFCSVFKMNCSVAKAELEMIKIDMTFIIIDDHDNDHDDDVDDSNEAVLLSVEDELLHGKRRAGNDPDWYDCHDLHDDR